ncbi:MAG TPA: hypothetical protein IAB06_06780 [Candidatus Avacidaminococcus intestinavium]|uniref:SGNH hydrolase-type esterase domain-containing protein n=1 Tax=Candidatus Avacidaminococcus intestinavium TaxID=2840684 RepID=A0A9D1MQS0_9FIRM|nr:hypothetical protein [Candidatus Avacidaminococcus intestinavium]
MVILIKKQVACFGDSIIYGFPYVDSSWLKTFNQNSTQLHLLNYGVCGFTYNDVLEKIQTTYLAPEIKAILLMAGLNDLLEGRPLKYIIDDLKKIVLFCQTKNLPTYIILPLLTKDQALNLKINDLKVKLCEEFVSTSKVLDLYPIIIDNFGIDNLLGWDGIHPSVIGYEQIALSAFTPLEEWGRQL